MKKHFEKIMIGWTVVVIAIVAVATTFLLVNIIGSKMTSVAEEDAASPVTMAAITSPATASAITDENVFEVDEEMQNDTGLDTEEGIYLCDYAYTTTRINFRQEPSESATVIMKLAAGTKITVVKKHDDTWAKIRYGGQTGYVTSAYLTATEPTQAPVVTRRPATPTPKPTRTPRPKKTPRPTARPTKEPVVTPQPQQPTQAPVEAPPATEQTPAETVPTPGDAATN